MDVLLVSADLMLVSQLGGAARGAGCETRTASGIESAVAGLGPQTLVLVDLAMPGLEIAALVARLRESTPPPRAIVAFAQHVHAARLQAAADAGCDEVLSRGQITSQAGQIVRRYAET